ncbi:NAD(P)/FAD-dependent oxidoreductase [Desulfobacterota bacterium AH_259_B03_O07]|nr:NAD(P)/FAD-dependent oxidoreductase [Desulfobacterota bacterium AH_259_B03_O07]
MSNKSEHKMDYDLLVIGAGTAGKSAALKAVSLGAHSAIVEENGFAGTCLGKGCVPKKILVSTVELYWRTKHAGQLGLTRVESLGIDWATITAWKDQMVESFSSDTKSLLERQGIKVFQGAPKFTGKNKLTIGDRIITAEKFVIATGSIPARPTIEGIEWAITSEEFIDLKSFPKRMVVIGGGLIAMEFGFCLARAGVKVAILQRGSVVIPHTDDEIRDALIEIGREAGMEFHTNVSVNRISKDRTVEANVNGTVENFPSDLVLVATGRPPNVANLNLGEAGVELEQGGVKVNEYLQSTSAPHVYAAGDVLGKPQHTPVAWYEGPIAAQNALNGNEHKVDLSLLPTVAYTIPALGQVGLTEADARKRGYKVAVKRLPFAMSPAVVTNDTEGLVKIVYDEETEKLLGVHILGARAEDIIQIAAVAMRGGLTLKDIGTMHHAFPTISEVFFWACADIPPDPMLGLVVLSQRA